MTQIMESLEPLREAASGYRKKLIEDGWSEADASSIATDLLIAMHRKAFQ